MTPLPVSDIAAMPDADEPGVDSKKGDEYSWFG